LALEVVGLATMPLAHRILPALPDRGYAAAKFLGLILVSYLAWVTGMLGVTGFTGATIIGFTVLLAAAGWWFWGGDVRASWRETRWLVLAIEVTFLVVFLLALWVRSYNSAIAGQEKQMDMTFLRSLIETTSLPAEDLWLARYGMPYYYLGYLTHAVVAKVVAVDAAVAYNLAVATVLALAAAGTCGLSAALVRLAGASRGLAVGFGAFGAFALAIMGNLAAFFEYISAQGIGDRAFWSAIGIKGLQGTAGPFPPAEWGWWFRSARVIPNIEPDGITEFPYFSFLLGDLHPHYMAIPLGVLIATLAAHAAARAAPLFWSPSRSDDRAEATRTSGAWTDFLWPLRGDWVRIVVTAVVLGAVIPFNTWDVPILWGVYALCYVLVGLSGDRIDWRTVLERVRDVAVVGVLAILLVAPYLFIGFKSQPIGIGLTRER
jgi:YYY domain-containing protein